MDLTETQQRRRGFESETGEDRFPDLRVVSLKINPPYLKYSAELRLIESTTLPPRALITAAHVLAFDDDALGLVRHERRGWDIPGGHLDHGESVEAAARREVNEEAALGLGELKVIGFWQYHCFGDPPHENQYPWPKSYMQLYAARVERIDPFEARFETKERIFVPLSSLPESTWGQQHPELLGMVDIAHERLGL